MPTVDSPWWRTRTRVVTAARALTPLFAVVLACQSSPATASPAEGCAFRYIGQALVASGTRFADSTLGEIEFGGLSGIDFDPDTGRYWVISDDRSVRGPARFYQLSIDLTRLVRANDADASAITIHSQHALRDADGRTQAPKSVDPEAIRRLPGGRLLAWSTEGARGYLAHQAPRIGVVDQQGRWQRDLTVPPAFVPVGSRGGDTDADRGVRNNLGFESLAVTPNGHHLYAAVENALVQDGPPSRATSASPSRVIEYDLRQGRAIAQFIYEVEPLPLRPLGALAPADNGLVELLALGDRRFLALERSFVLGVGVRARLYWVDAREASDVSAIARLAQSKLPYRPAVKHLVLDLSDLRSDNGASIWLDNIEGISFGPRDPRTGEPTLVFVADNNFSWLQSTQFIAVAVRDLPALVEGRGAGICLAVSSAM